MFSIRKMKIIATLSGVAAFSHFTIAAETEFAYTGYIKLDTLISLYSDGESPALNRDFYIPGLIPVSDAANAEDSGVELDMHVRQTRFIFQTKTLLDNGEEIGTKLELDFQVLPGANERISNSFPSRVRQAYITYKNFLFGQAWSTFQILSVLPDSVDFIGVTDGVIFDRQAMIRYTNGPFQFALENPESTISNFQAPGRIVSDDNSIPDLVFRYNWGGDWGNFTAAFLARQLACNDLAFGCDDTTSSYGINLGGKINVGDKDDIRFSVNSGTGLGRYLSLNTSNGAVFDANGDLETIDTTAFSFAYRHFWNDEWRSSFMVAAQDIDNDTALTGVGVTSATSSARINAIYSPVPDLHFGFEVSHARRELENNSEGNMNRFQFSVQYNF